METATARSTYTTVTIFRYPSSARWWAFQQMGLAPPVLRSTEGIRFFQLMGSGRGAVFSLRPDWTRYVLLATWESPDAAQAFFSHAPLMESFRQRAEEIWTIGMLPIKAHGEWNGVNPFPLTASPLSENTPLAVLTRASIRWRALWPFWRSAPRSAHALEEAKGLLFSCGIGELPIVRQATFSIWENVATMKAFAYGSAHHREAMRAKAEQDWYSEELFARFSIVHSDGAYLGNNLLAHRITTPLPHLS